MNRALFAVLALVACGAPMVDDAPAPSVDDAPAGPALDHVAANFGSYGLDRLDDTVLSRVVQDELGMTHVHFDQRHRGVPVWGGSLGIHLRHDGSIRRTTDHLVADLAVDVHADIPADAATALAIDAWGEAEWLTAAPEVALWVMRRPDADHLVWGVQLERLDGTDATSRPLLFIDAHSGDEVWRYENLHTASGTSTYDGTVTIGTYEYDGWFYLEDTTWAAATFTFGNTTDWVDYVYDADDEWTTASQSDAVQTHWAMAQFLQYLDEVHGRAALDDLGGPTWEASLTGSGDVLSAYTDYGTRYVNAFWNGTVIVIGDGDGSASGPLSSRDVVAHELAHGVTQFTSGFAYVNESGALNEATSDIFAAAFDDWLGYTATSDVFWIGEDCWTPRTSGDALRYMEDPTADGASRDHYSDRYTGSADSGGVHWNSGIANVAFYLMAEGGAHPTYGGKVSGIGIEDAMAIWYRAISVYGGSSTNFSDFRDDTWAAAEDLFLAGGPEVAAVLDAWDAVGVK